MSIQNNPHAETIKTDIAIIGGGSAGITLATKLKHQTSVVIEPKTPEQRDVSWALWATENHQKEIAAATKGRWNKWRLIDHKHEIIHKSDKYHYTSLSSADYLRHCENKLSSNISLVRESADNIIAEGNGGTFTAAGKKYFAHHIYDSRPAKLDENGLKQHFLGIEIRTKKPLNEVDIATLMDFRVDQSKGLHFIYALPFSERTLLIESTMISATLEPKEWYKQGIYQWLDDQSIEIEEITREEYGVIPMHETTPEDTKLMRIGSASGAVRLSSGYAFTNIQAQISQLAANIERGEFSVPQVISSNINQLDKIYNSVLIANPTLGVELMMKTAGALDADGFSRFMLGKATFKDWIRVILAMPKIPFLTQVFRL
ncbi:MAG: lycopene cyclase family protein [Porticoccaceae bacterium]